MHCANLATAVKGVSSFSIGMWWLQEILGVDEVETATSRVLFKRNNAHHWDSSVVSSDKILLVINLESKDSWNFIRLIKRIVLISLTCLISLTWFLVFGEKTSTEKGAVLSVATFQPCTWSLERVVETDEAVGFSPAGQQGPVGGGKEGAMGGLSCKEELRGSLEKEREGKVTPGLPGTSPIQSRWTTGRPIWLSTGICRALGSIKVPHWKGLKTEICFRILDQVQSLALLLEALHGPDGFLGASEVVNLVSEFNL